MSFSALYPFSLPELPPLAILKDDNLIELLLNARTELGELKGYAYSIPSPMTILSPTIIRESVASSHIENIHTTVEKVLQLHLFPESEQREPDKEAKRYHDAVTWGYEQMKTIPLSNRLILGIHQKLMLDKSHGYRKTQNSILNQSTGQAIYTPPPANEIPNLMSNWEKFLHNQLGPDNLEPLIKCAICHYQFEAIHPFTDGNGRTGRMLIILQLIHEKLLNLPILYISSYINQNRDEYYRLLLEVTTLGNWIAFIRFIVRGIYLQAKATKETLFKIMSLFEDYRNIVKKDYKHLYGSELIENIFAHPIITPVKLAARMEIHYTTASRYLKELVRANLLTDRTHGKYHFYINQRLLDLVKN
jgi:Fic family protein